MRVRGLSRDEIATRALHTTSDFPAILAAVTNKTLRDAYEAAPRTFPPIARRATAADFKDMHRLQLGEAPQLEKVNEAGEFKRGSLGEGKESYRVETWGKVIGITRQVIINDDLDAFTRIPALFGTAAATLESDVVWGIVTANPNMADGVALFHATHKNLAGTGTALDVANLGKARAQMAKQTGLDGKTVLNIRPAFLVVPSSLELTAEQLIAQNLVPAKSTDVVPAVDPLAQHHRRAAGSIRPRARCPGTCSPARRRSTPSSTPISRVRTASTSRPAWASTSTASRSRRGSTSAPRRSTGAVSSRTPAWRRKLRSAAASGRRP